MMDTKSVARQMVLEFADTFGKGEAEWVAFWEDRFGLRGHGLMAKLVELTKAAVLKGEARQDRLYHLHVETVKALPLWRRLLVKLGLAEHYFDGQGSTEPAEELTGEEDAALTAFEVTGRQLAARWSTVIELVWVREGDEWLDCLRSYCPKPALFSAAERRCLLDHATLAWYTAACRELGADAMSMEFMFLKEGREMCLEHWPRGAEGATSADQWFWFDNNRWVSKNGQEPMTREAYLKAGYTIVLDMGTDDVVRDDIVPPDEF